VLSADLLWLDDVVRLAVLSYGWVGVCNCVLLAASMQVKSLLLPASLLFHDCMQTGACIV
jgi:hypothetical protein